MSIFSRKTQSPTKLIGKKIEPNPENAWDIAEEHLGRCGKILPHEQIMEVHVVKNANLCTTAGKIWFGDLNLVTRGDDLTTIATTLGRDLYILREMDGRFDHEQKPLIDKAVKHITPQND